MRHIHQAHKAKVIDKLWHLVAILALVLVWTYIHPTVEHPRPGNYILGLAIGLAMLYPMAWRDIRFVLKKCKGPLKLWKVDHRYGFSDPLGRNSLLQFWDSKIYHDETQRLYDSRK